MLKIGAVYKPDGRSQQDRPPAFGGRQQAVLDAKGRKRRIQYGLVRAVGGEHRAVGVIAPGKNIVAQAEQILHQRNFLIGGHG